MTNQPTPVRDRSALPAGLAVLEIPVAPGVNCLVEYLRRDGAGDETGTTAVVLLHDLDRDLDDHRSLALFLFEAGFNVLNIDLPGHGMSGGAVADMPAAITAAALFAVADGSAGVAYVAAGRLGPILLALPPDDAATLVMLQPDPRADGQAELPAEGWEYVPSLYLVDPASADSDEYAQQLASASRAWNLRCFVHGDEPTQPGSRPAGSTWEIQSANLTRSFLSEQTFYWRLNHQRSEGAV
jgi:pimeloyl-ACP methyl ester carboxylesterase